MVIVAVAGLALVTQIDQIKSACYELLCTWLLDAGVCNSSDEVGIWMQNLLVEVLPFFGESAQKAQNKAVVYEQRAQELAAAVLGDISASARYSHLPSALSVLFLAMFESAVKLAEANRKNLLSASLCGVSFDLIVAGAANPFAVLKVMDDHKHANLVDLADLSQSMRSLLESGALTSFEKGKRRKCTTDLFVAHTPSVQMLISSSVIHVFVVAFNVGGARCSAGDLPRP